MSTVVSMSRLDLSGIVWNHKESPPRKREASSKRSDLPMPGIVTDIKPYQSMATGEWITSRTQHRDHLKRHDLIELGNDRVDTKRIKREQAAKRRAALRDDLHQAVRDYKDGKRSREKPQDAAAVGITTVAPDKPIRAHVPEVRPSLIV